MKERNESTEELKDTDEKLSKEIYILKLKSNCQEWKTQQIKPKTPQLKTSAVEQIQKKKEYHEQQINS